MSYPVKPSRVPELDSTAQRDGQFLSDEADVLQEVEHRGGFIVGHRETVR